MGKQCQAESMQQQLLCITAPDVRSRKESEEEVEGGDLECVSGGSKPHQGGFRENTVRMQIGKSLWGEAASVAAGCGATSPPPPEGPPNPLITGSAVSSAGATLLLTGTALGTRSHQEPLAPQWEALVSAWR